MEVCMTINEFLNTYLDKIELFKEGVVVNPTAPFSTVKVLNRPSKVDLSSALLTSNDIDEFEYTVKALAESYNIKLTGHVNQEIYRNRLSLLKVYLTKLLFTEPNNKKVESYLKILEKRFKDCWNEKYSNNNEKVDNEIHLTFEVVNEE